jgi:hypothetical protein
MTFAVSIAKAFEYEKFHSSHGHPSISSKLDYDSLFNEAEPISKSTEGSRLLEECLEAYGGVENLKKLESLRFSWRMSALMTADTIDVVKTVSFNRQYKIERNNLGGVEIRILTGDKAWFQSEDTLLNLDQGRYKAELFSYLVLGMPMATKTETFTEIRYGQRDGDSLSYVYCNKQDSLLIILGIDPVDKMIKKAEGVIRQQEEYFVFINHFSDFRKYGDYIFPYAMTNISMGLTVAMSVLKQVEINVELSDSDFSPSDALRTSKFH